MHHAQSAAIALQGIPPDLMSTVFPFHVVFDRQGKVMQHGDNLLRLCPALSCGANIGDFFRILTPISLAWTLDSISSQLFSVFFVECLKTGHVIKGQMIVLDRAKPDLIAFLCSPLVPDVGGVKRLGLSFNDFALHDATVDFLFLLQTQVTTIEDVRSLAERLKREVQVRREAQHALQITNEQLEQRVNERTADLAIEKDKAEAANKTKSAFLSNMSHELRTPLNAILGYAQILQLDNNLEARQITSLQTINESGEHLLMLITDLLDLAKIESGKFEVLVSVLNLQNFLKAVMEMLRVRAEQKQLLLLLELAPDLPTLVLMDEKRVRQILLNLLSNAVKFTDRGQVSLRVLMVRGSPAQACLRFEIEDSGVGIHPDQVGIIFKPFEQVGDQHKQLGGTGLGLPISQQLVELMNSKIQVQSTPEQGSVFWFDLVLDLPASSVACIDNAREITACSEDVDDAAAAPLPPRQEIEQLYQFALAGNMRKITQHGAYLLTMDQGHHPFVDKLNALAGAYQTKALLKFIEAHMTGAPTA